jgi:transposase
LPKCYGYWHSIYLRFKKGSDRGVWWKILIELQRFNKLKVNIVMSDSTTIKYHRHGGGLKKTSKVGEDRFQE